MKHFIKISFKIITWICIFPFLCESIHAQNVTGAKSGSIEGVVQDSKTKNTLPGVNISIKGIHMGTATDEDGEFEFEDLTEGTYTLVFSFIGYETKTVDVKVEADEKKQLKISLKDQYTKLKDITVTGIRQGQAIALNKQKEAANITNVVDAQLIEAFPDPNVGESLKRIPGISVQADQGEARYIQIRGTNPSLSSVDINGVKIGSPEGDNRSVALDFIPSDQLGSIEVTKAITPDMDGDAIGGAVNLVTKSALSSNRVTKITLNGNYNNNLDQITPWGGRASGSFGQRLGEDNAFGYLVGANFNKLGIGTDDNEMDYDGTDLETIELRDYELTRKRFGIHTNLDYKFNKKSKLYLNAFYSYYADGQVRRATILEADEVGREFKNRTEKNRIISTSFGGQHGFGNGFNIDYQFAYSYSDQRKPYDRSFNFAQSYEDANGDDIDFISFSRQDPDFPQFSLTPSAPVNAGVYNYDQFNFDEVENKDQRTSEHQFTPKLDISKNYVLSNKVAGILKFGGKISLKKKEQDNTVEVYDGFNGGTPFTDLLGDFEDEDYLMGKYSKGVGLFPSKDNAHDFFVNNQSNFELAKDDSKEDSNAEDFHAAEDTYAAYAMTTLNINHLTTIIGMRYAHLSSDYTGNIVEYDENENQSIRPAEDTKDHDFILPMVHLKYNINDRANIRFAWTNSYAKANYFDLVPYRIISRVDEEIELGNPDLDPTRSMNFDFLGEYYFKSIGVISAGIFYKRLNDFIYTANFDYGDAPYVGYEAEQPLNGQDADLFGIEINLQNQLSFLPGFASGFGIYANYTYTWSQANLNSKGGSEREVSLPGQAGNIANVSLSYQKFGFNGRISLNYNGSYVEEIRESSSSDRYYDNHTQLDLSLSQDVAPHFTVFANLVNLTNEPLRYYNGVPTRPEQQEYYSFHGKLGVKMNF